MYHRKLVFAAACLGMLMFGIVFTTIGAILPSVIEEFGVNKTSAGSLMLFMTFGMLLGSLIFGPIVDRYGYKILLIVCASFLIMGLEGIAAARSFTLLRIMAFIIGFSGGVINGGTNALVADISQEGKGANLSLLGAFFGIGAIGIPLLLGSLLSQFTYQTIIASVGLTVTLPLLFFLFIKFPVPKQAQGFPLRKGLGLLKEKTLLLFGIILFFQSGMEITVSGWAAVFMKEELRLEASNAALLLSFYWFGIMGTRLVLGQLLKSVSSAKTFIVSISVAFIGSVTLLLSHSSLLTTTGLLLVGAGFAGIYPIILGYVGILFPHLSGTAFSIVLVMALIGGMIYPSVTGIIGDSCGLRTALILIPISLCCSVLIFQKIAPEKSTKNVANQIN